MEPQQLLFKSSFRCVTTSSDLSLLKACFVVERRVAQDGARSSLSDLVMVEEFSVL